MQKATNQGTERETFLQIRGDALFMAFEQVEKDLTAQLEAVRGVMEIIRNIDAQIGLTGQPRPQLVGLMRQMYPEQTKDLTDEQVIAMVGKQK